jgi:hypothetical protein
MWMPSGNDRVHVPDQDQRSGNQHGDESAHRRGGAERREHALPGDTARPLGQVAHALGIDAVGCRAERVAEPFF